MQYFSQIQTVEIPILPATICRRVNFCVQFIVATYQGSKFCINNLVNKLNSSMLTNVRKIKKNCNKFTNKILYHWEM